MPVLVEADGLGLPDGDADGDPVGLPLGLGDSDGGILTLALGLARSQQQFRSRAMPQ